MHTRLCDTFGVEFPIFAFSHCRDVVAAVSRAGGFGVLGAVAFTPDELEVELRWIDEHIGGKPYGVDIVMPASSVTADMAAVDPKQMEAALQGMIPEEHRQWIEGVLKRHNVPPLPAGEPAFRGLLGWTGSAARSHVDVALSHPIKLLVNALGPPPKDVVDSAHDRGVLVAALVGTAHQAKKQVDNGVDIVVAQGTEAGGHTGEVATMVLVPEVIDTIQPTPVLAAGGIGSGRQMAAALALGADGVWTGSIWMTVAESDTDPAVKEKLLRASSRDTVRSKCLSGKPARQLRTAWTEAWDGPDSPGTLPMPLQFMATAEAITRIHKYAHNDKYGAKDLAGAPIGQIVGSIKAVRPTREVIYEMVTECMDTINRMAGMMPGAEKR